MNFFEDDFGFGDSPKKPNKKASQPNRNSYPSQNAGMAKDDDFGDLLDDLLTKEQNRKSRENQRQKNKSVESFTSNKISPPKNQLDKTDKFEPFDRFKSSKEISLNDTGPKYNQQSVPNIFMDKDDDIKDIFGFKGANETQNFQKKAEAPEFFVAGSMRGMKPPLRKRGDSRQNSVRERSVKEPSIASYQDFKDEQQLPLADFNFNKNNGSMMNLNFEKPPMQKRNSQANLYASEMPPLPNQKSGREQSPQQIIKQKIVYVKQPDQKQKQRHAEQIATLKSEKDKQIDQISKRLMQETEQRKKMLSEFSKQRQKDRQISQTILKRQIENIKQMHLWETNKKTEIYEMEITQLKKINQLLQEQIRNMNKYDGNSHVNMEEFRIKERELEYRKNKLETQERTLKERERALEGRQFDFDNYRMKQEERLQQDRKKLYEMQAELDRRKIQFRKTIQQQKSSISHTLATQEIEYQRKKQALKREKEEMQLQAQLFDKKRDSFDEFNSNILKQYKRKLREVEEEKEKLQQLQIDVYKKLHTVELMGEIKMPESPQPKRKQNESLTNNIHAEKRNNNLNRTQNTKNRYQKIQEAIDLNESIGARSGTRGGDLRESTNLKSYLLKMNRDNVRKRPFF